MSTSQDSMLSLDGDTTPHSSRRNGLMIVDGNDNGSTRNESVGNTNWIWLFLEQLRFLE